jgi:hypothetical protein
MGIIFRFATASGIPMIVIAMAIAVTTCPIASHRPAMTNQMTLPISETTSVRPGEVAYDPGA